MIGEQMEYDDQFWRPAHFSARFRWFISSNEQGIKIFQRLVKRESIIIWSQKCVFQTDIDVELFMERSTRMLFRIHCADGNLHSSTWSSDRRRNNEDHQCDNIHLLQACRASTRCRRWLVHLLSIGREMTCFCFRSKTVRKIPTQL